MGKNLEFEIGLPYCLPTIQETLDSFKKLWTSLDHNIEILYENIQIKKTAALIVTCRLLQFVQSSKASLNQILHSKVSIVQLGPNLS